MMADELQNGALALFVDSLFGLNLATSIYMITYSKKALTTGWNFLWLGVIYPAFWWFKIRPKIQDLKEKRAREIFNKGRKKN
jgi:hypothetical protein